MRYLFILFASLMIAGCGSGGGDSAPPTVVVAPEPASVDRPALVRPASVFGMFVGEPSATVTVWQGARLGEISVPVKTLGFTVTGRDGYEFRTTDGKALLRLKYDAAAGLVEIIRPAGSDYVSWLIEKPVGGDG